MKVCPHCGDSYRDHVDFCFGDGEVLILVEATAPSQGAGLVPGAPSEADLDPPVPRRVQGAQIPAAAPTAQKLPDAKVPDAKIPEVPRVSRPGVLLEDEAGGPLSWSEAPPQEGVAADERAASPTDHGAGDQVNGYPGAYAHESSANTHSLEQGPGAELQASAVNGAQAEPSRFEEPPEAEAPSPVASAAYEAHEQRASSDEETVLRDDEDGSATIPVALASSQVTVPMERPNLSAGRALATPPQPHAEAGENREIHEQGAQQAQHQEDAALSEAQVQGQGAQESDKPESAPLGEQAPASQASPGRSGRGPVVHAAPSTTVPVSPALNVAPAPLSERSNRASHQQTIPALPIHDRPTIPASIHTHPTMPPQPSLMSTPVGAESREQPRVAPSLSAADTAPMPKPVRRAPQVSVNTSRPGGGATVVDDRLDRTQADRANWWLFGVVFTLGVMFAVVGAGVLLIAMVVQARWTSAVGTGPEVTPEPEPVPVAAPAPRELTPAPEPLEPVVVPGAPEPAQPKAVEVGEPVPAPQPAEPQPAQVEQPKPAPVVPDPVPVAPAPKVARVRVGMLDRTVTVRDKLKPGNATLPLSFNASGEAVVELDYGAHILVFEKEGFRSPETPCEVPEDGSCAPLAWTPISSSGSGDSPMMVRVLVTADGAAKVRVDGAQEFPANTMFKLPEGKHTFVLIGENGFESQPYEREVLLPKNRPNHHIALPALTPSTP